MRRLTRTEVKFVVVFWIVATIAFIAADQLAGSQGLAVDLAVGFVLVLGAVFVHRFMLKRQNRNNG